jgi:hypothetical protein
MHDPLITLSAATLLVPPTGDPPRPPHRNALWRWATRGVRGRLLRSEVVGGFRYTRPSWVREFLAAGAADRGPAAPPRRPTDQQTRRRARAAREALTKK